MAYSPSSPPLVSVIVACYNQADFVVSAIKSIINQSYPSIEIIAVNDGSTDNTLNVLENLKTSTDKLSIITTENQGLAATRNTGLQYAHGIYVSFLDSDDLYLPNRLKIHIDYLLQRQNTTLSYSETRYFYTNP